MSPDQQFIYEMTKLILTDGKGFLLALLSAFGVGGAIGWHVPVPPWMKKEKA